MEQVIEQYLQDRGEQLHQGGIKEHNHRLGYLKLELIKDGKDSCRIKIFFNPNTISASNDVGLARIKTGVCKVLSGRETVAKVEWKYP